jgi:hypothetical protein
MQMLRAGVVVGTHQQRAAVAVAKQRGDGGDGDTGLYPPRSGQVPQVMVMQSESEL